MRHFQSVMTRDQQIQYSEHRWGRMWLHVLAMVRDRNIAWHLRGIFHEFRIW